MSGRADPAAPRVAAEVTPPRETRIVRGVLSIVGATLLFVCMNTAVKFLSPSLSTVQLLWSRSLGHTTCSSSGRR